MLEILQEEKLKRFKLKILFKKRSKAFNEAHEAHETGPHLSGCSIPSELSMSTPRIVQDFSIHCMKMNIYQSHPTRPNLKTSIKIDMV